MKILTIGNFGRGWDNSICDEEHIASALEELGHTVYRVQREETSGIPLTDGLPDFTLVAQWDGHEDLSHLPRPIVYWAFDYQADGQEWHEKLVVESDLYLSKRIADSKYPNWQWLSQDFAPSFLDKYPLPIEKDIDVLFTGSYLPWAGERNATICAVAEKFKLVIHSTNSWPEEYGLDVRPPIMDEGLPELYARAKVILSIDHTIEAGYWSDRNAQIMACGGLVLFRYVPLSEVRFTGASLALFYDTQHCLDQLEGLLIMADEDLELVRAVGYEVAHDNLMVKHRVDDLLTIVEGIL